MIVLNWSSFMKFLYKGSSWFQITSPRSLSTDFSLFTSQTHFSLSKLHSQEIFGLKIIFLHLVCWFLPLSYAFHIVLPNFWDFWSTLGFFKINEVFVQFLGWVLLHRVSNFMHCITCALQQCFIHFRCVFYFVAMLCAGRLRLGWAHNVFKFACDMFMHTYLQVSIFVILHLVGAFLIVFLPLSLILTLVASWHLNINPLCPGTHFILRHLLLLLLLTPLHLTSGSVMRRPNWTFLRTFHDKAFIQNAKSFYQTFLTLTYPLSSTKRVGSHYVAPQSCVLGSKDLGFYVFRTLICIVGKPWSKLYLGCFRITQSWFIVVKLD